MKSIERLLKSGKFVTVEFIKKDGTIGKVNGRYGVKKHTKGGVNTCAHKTEYVTLYDVRKGYRNVNINTIVKINNEEVS